MRVAIVQAGVAISVLDLPGFTVDEDGKAARCQTFSERQDLPGGDIIQIPYESVVHAGEDCTMIVNEMVDLGATWNGTSFIPPAAPPAAVPEVISRTQFYHQLFVAGLISEAVALAGMNGTMAVPVTNAIAALPVSDQFAAKVMLAGPSVPRSAAFLTHMEIPDLDAFFTAAAHL